MEESSRLSPEQRADLVAYLDGELDEETADALEQTLAHSPVARHEVDMLTRTWALMDSLPQPTPSQEFAVRTLTAIRIDNAPVQPLAERAWVGQFRRGAIILGLVALLAAGGFAGFHVTHNLLPDRNEQLLNDLEVIEHLDEYSDIRSLNDLKELENQKLFDENPDPRIR